MYKSFFHQQEDMKEKYRKRCKKEIEDFQLCLDKLPSKYIQSEEGSMMGRVGEIES